MLAEINFFAIFLLEAFTMTKLSEAQIGKHKVISIEGGASVKDKLLCQGVLPGKEIAVVTRKNNGPCVIEVGLTKIIIGGGMAEKIMVD